MSAGGVPSLVPYMKTAVPGTRIGGSAARSASSILSGTVFSSMRLPRISRPRFQEIGRASCRGRVEKSVVRVLLYGQVGLLNKGETARSEILRLISQHVVR